MRALGATSPANFIAATCTPVEIQTLPQRRDLGSLGITLSPSCLIIPIPVWLQPRRPEPAKRHVKVKAR